VKEVSEGLGCFPTSKICPASHSADGQIYGKGYPFPMLANLIKNYWQE